MIKIVALGLIFGKKTYLKNYYNIIDFSIILISIIGYIFEYTSDSGQWIQVLKVFRGLRVLKVKNNFID